MTRVEDLSDEESARRVAEWAKEQTRLVLTTRNRPGTAGPGTACIGSPAWHCDLFR